MSYIQNFFTSRDNNANAETYVGQVGRLWWDPDTNQIYYSDGSTPGGIPVTSGGGGTPGGANTQVQFNDDGVFGGAASVTFDKNTGALITSTLSAAGNVYIGQPMTFTPAAANLQYGGTAEYYLQFNMQNRAAYATSTTDMAVTADNGDDTTSYMDMGITSSAYSDADYTIYGPNDGYLVAAGNVDIGGGNLILSTYTNRDIVFTLGGGNTENEVGRFSYTDGFQVTGNVSATANISGVYIIGDGSQLTNVSSTPGNVFNTVLANGTPLVADSPNDTLTLTAGNNLVITGNTATDTAVFAVSNSPNFSGSVTANNFVGSATTLTSVLTDRGSDPPDWDSNITMGVYTVNRTSWSGTTGAPLDSQVFVGLLEVKNSTSTAIEQIFYPGTVQSDVYIQWNRARWGGSWTPWISITNNSQTIVGGDF